MGSSSRPTFHGHRIYPRYAPLVRASCRYPSLTPWLLRMGRGFLQDQTASSSEDPGLDDRRATRIVICGVQRSGTTFLAQAAEILLEAPGRVWHSHDPWIARDFIPHGIPVIVTVRDPLDSAVSKAVYHSDAPTAQALCRRIDLVTAWYRLVAHEPRSPLLTIAEFGEFTQYPQKSLADIMPTPVAVDMTTHDIRARVEWIDRHQHLDSEQTHLPHTDRLERQAQFQEFANVPSVQRRLAQARDAQERVRQNHTP